MKVVIVEDETAAARNLQAIIRKVLPDAEVLATLESIEESVEWFSACSSSRLGNPSELDCSHAQRRFESHPEPDLLFMDIHLADGESFRIFDSVEITCPVIFTTAYDQYALDAFKVNSIDYLLKPIKEEELRHAIDKLERLSGVELANRREVIATAVRNRDEQKVFLIPVRDKIIPLKIERIAFFHTADERVRAFDYDGTAFPMDKSLDKLSKMLSERDFFRANRQFIVARGAVEDITVWFGSRLSLNLKVKAPERIVVSKDRVPEFKRWFTER